MTARRWISPLVAITLCCATMATHAAAADIALPGDAVYPENVAAGADGTLYVSSFVQGGILKVAPGATKAEVWIAPGTFSSFVQGGILKVAPGATKAEVWIAPGTFGSRSTFGALPDVASNTLWVCSNDLSGIGIPGPGDAQGSALIAFDLKTGAGKIRVPFPVSPALCNDIALGTDGAVYATNTLGNQIFRLPPGGTALDVWKTDPLFQPAPKEAGLDGITFGADGNLYLTTFTKAKLLRVDVKDGKPGAVTELKPSLPLAFADGIRPLGDNAFVLAEGSGRIDRVTVSGDAATIEVLKDGIAGGVTGVTVVGPTVFASVGQLPLVLDPARKGTAPDLPFKVLAVPLTQP